MWAEKKKISIHTLQQGMCTIVFKICMLQIGIRVPPIHHHAQVLIGVNSQKK